jgi:hypothetical protein
VSPRIERQQILWLGALIFRASNICNSGRVALLATPQFLCRLIRRIYSFHHPRVTRSDHNLVRGFELHTARDAIGERYPLLRIPAGQEIVIA